MNSPQRRQLIKDRLKAIRERPLSLARKGWMGFGNAPFGTTITPNHAAKWVSMPIAKPSSELKPRRTKRVSALTRISQQLPRKLPVIFPKL